MESSLTQRKGKASAPRMTDRETQRFLEQKKELEADPSIEGNFWKSYGLLWVSISAFVIGYRHLEPVIVRNFSLPASLEPAIYWLMVAINVPQFFIHLFVVLSNFSLIEYYSTGADPKQSPYKYAFWSLCDASGFFLIAMLKGSMSLFETILTFVHVGSIVVAFVYTPTFHSFYVRNDPLNHPDWRRAFVKIPRTVFAAADGIFRIHFVWAFTMSYFGLTAPSLIAK